MGILDGFLHPPEYAPYQEAARSLLSGIPVMEQKAAFDLIPTGIQGRPQYPSTDITSLQKHYTRNEMVYAAIDIKATSAMDPELVYQERNNDGDWVTNYDHPITRLHMRPNSGMDESGFMRAFITNHDSAGEFYAEIVRGESGLPVELHPLNPAKMAPIPGGGKNSVDGVIEYEFKDGNRKIKLPAKDVLVYRKFDPTERYRGLSPLAVCLGSVDADSAQTDYLRAFFNNAGVPSGLLKVKGTLTEPRSQEIKAQWRLKYGRAWGNQHDVAVLDDNADYMKLGANLDELESEAIRSFTESRIAMVFGVPPLIIYSYTGLLRATYSNLKEAWRGFWDATLTPLYKEYRTWLTWSLLTEFVDPELIYARKVRLWWDLSGVAALQDDVDAVHKRAEAAFKAGGITLNEYRALIGEKPDPAGDYYVRPMTVGPVIVGDTPVQQVAAGTTEPKALTNGHVKEVLA